MSESSQQTQQHDGTSNLDELLDTLVGDPDREQIRSEIEVLQSIYGENSIRKWNMPEDSQKRFVNDEKIRYEVHLCLPTPYEDITIRVLVSLPRTYPSSSPPQLQLLSRYIGAFGADANLFGSVLRTYISLTGVEWSEDVVCVFDGLQIVLERCTTWYEERLRMEKAGELMREDSRRHSRNQIQNDYPMDGTLVLLTENIPVELPVGVQMYTAEPIADRKSTFVGRACQITNPFEVPTILLHLMSDRRISRAAHPTINAWRCQVEGVLHQDNDDDGETAAGGRLAHLLQILEVSNVLVVVTRHFGGIHLGPDRFKHINQAARNALELGGFLDVTEMRKNSGRDTGRGYHKVATGFALNTVKQHESPSLITLFGANFCPFVQRVWVALELLGIPYQYYEVDPYKKPNDLLEVSPKGLVPALKLAEGSLNESTVILEFLNDMGSYRGHTILPPPSLLYGRALIRLGADHVNRSLVPSFYRYLQAQDTDKQIEYGKEFHASIDSLVKLLQRAEQELLPFGSKGLGAWLPEGDDLGWVDIMAGPWLYRASIVLTHYRGFQMPKGERFNAWLQRLFEHPAFKATCSTNELYLDSYERYAFNRPNTSLVATAINEGRSLP